jgi:hypothetical protein
MCSYSKNKPFIAKCAILINSDAEIGLQFVMREPSGMELWMGERK